MNVELTNPDWDKFRGNNREKIELPDVFCGGSVDLASYIGKPLSKELWIDLVHRLMISGLCVYSYGSPEWTIGWDDGHCIINLDKFDNVERIYFYPHRSILYHTEKSNQQLVKELSECIKSFIKPLKTNEQLKIEAVELLRKHNLLNN